MTYKVTKTLSCIRRAVLDFRFKIHELCGGFESRAKAIGIFIGPKNVLYQ
jgi:hypothetical protein